MVMRHRTPDGHLTTWWFYFAGCTLEVEFNRELFAFGMAGARANRDAGAAVFVQFGPLTIALLTRHPWRVKGDYVASCEARAAVCEDVAAEWRTAAAEELERRADTR